MPYVNCPDFSKLSLFASPQHPDYVDSLLNSIFRICSRNTSGSSLIAHAKADDGFRPIVAVQTHLDLCYLHSFTFSRIPNANCVADLDIHRHTDFFSVYHDVETICAFSE